VIPRRVELLDTSVLVELLGLPFVSDQKEEVRAEFTQRTERGTELLLPLATIVETGQHVERVADGHRRRECADRFARVLQATVDRKAPWSFSPTIRDPDLVAELIEPQEDAVPSLTNSLARQELEMGDLLILAEFRSLRSNLDPRARDVDVWTHDSGL
jgi:predicted nucleic acid-binding protein